MKILVTGGAGYKGIKLTHSLLKLGYDVTVIDNFMYGFEPFLHLVEYQNLKVIKQDIRNPVESIRNYDVIFHLAGLSGFPACSANPSSAHLINVDATKQIVKSLSKGQLFIYASTTSFYGKSGSKCNEETPVDPVSHYGKTKYLAEKVVMDHENAISLRFATVFGFSPRMRMDLMVNDFTYKALKEGVVVLFDSYAKRTFIHIEDAIRGYLFAMDHHDKMHGGVYNVGGDEMNFSKLEIAEAVKKQISYTIIDSDVRDKDVRHFIIDFSKIKQLGFAPEFSLDNGIERMLGIFHYYDYFTHHKTI